eukprot:TRINITY_DN1196_c0_g1_i12.p2 TRINITY_DN1196_c0_g1~~TRINITY_DN1196_c0_g1_i12.p2  ORF type:complete len:173 (-),score=56.52 TRINITY_DN1196_c0_g1_i12:358-876(-)
MAIGGALLATSVLALCAISRSCVGTVARVFFVLATLLAMAALVLLAVVTPLIASNNRPDIVEDLVRDSWERTASSSEAGVVAEACAVQSEFGCAAFVAGVCVDCPTAPPLTAGRVRPPPHAQAVGTTATGISPPAPAAAAVATAAASAAATWAAAAAAAADGDGCCEVEVVR